MANVNANINVNVNTQQASAQLRKLSADISRFNQQSFAANSAAAQQQRALNQALIDGVRTSGQFRTSIVPITSAVDRFATSIEKGQLSLGQYTRYAASQLPGMRRIFTREFDMINRVATSRVKTLNTQFVALGDSVGGAQKALAMTPVALDQYSSKAAIALQRTQIFNRLLRDGSTQLLNWGKNTQWAGRQLMVGFTIPLGILGAQAAKVFKELEAEAVNFRKVYGDMFTTDVEVEKNLQAVKELATEMTKYGISIQQSMELANVAAQSGARGQDLISQTTEATRLAVLGQMEQQEAIKTTITLQNAFQLSNEELTESINFLNVVENQSVLSLQNVTEAIPRVAPVIKSLGGDVKDLSVMLVAMREGGVSAAEGANALKTSLARLVSPTAGAVKMAEKFGINLQNIVVENKGDILGAVMELADAMKVLDDLSQQQLMSEIFGKRQYARIGALFNNITNEASQAQRVLELTTMSTRDLAATAERELGAVEESVSAKFTGAMERAKLALAPVGEEFLKALTPVVDFIGKILSKFAELPDGLKTAIVAATGIIGGLAPIVLMVTGLVANGIANIGKFILFLRKQVATLRGNGEAFKMYSSAELEAAAAAASLEGKTSSLTATMHLQKPAIETLITLYTRLAASARSAAAAMPATMGGVGVPTAAAAAATRGGGFAAVAPKLPVAYRNTGGPIFESASGKTRVPGSGNTDTVPAMLTPGEFVINKESTKKNLPLIKAINDGKVKTSNQSAKIPSIEPQVQYANIGAWIAMNLRKSWLSSPGRSSAPASLRQSIPQSIRKSTEDNLRKVLGQAGIRVEDIPASTWRDMSKVDLAHIKPDIDPTTGQKRWKLKNLMSTPGLENNGLDFLFGTRRKKNREMFLGLIDNNPKFAKEYSSQISKIITRKNHPSTQKDFEFLEKLFQILRSDPQGAKWLSGNSKAAKFWFPAMDALVKDRLNKNSIFGLPVAITRDKRLAALDKTNVQQLNSGGYVGSSSMYDPRYMRGQSGSRTIDRLKNYRSYKAARRNVKATTSYKNRNRRLRRFRPSDPRTLLDYAIPQQHRFVSMPTAVPVNRKARLDAANDLDGRFVKSPFGKSVGSTYQYKAQADPALPFTRGVFDRAGIRGYDLVPAPQSVLRDKYGRFISREEYNKRQKFRQILSTTSNSQIRSLMRSNEMERRRNYRKGAFYRFGDDAVTKEEPLYNPGRGLSSRLGQDRGMAELKRDRESGVKPALVQRPDNRDPREKKKSIKVRPGERVLLPNGQVYTNTSRNTKYITNPYYKPKPGKQWVNPETGMPYDLGGQADVDRRTTFRNPTLSKTTNPANMEKLAYMGWPFAQTEARKVNRTGEFSAFGFNKGGQVPGVQYLMAGAQVLSRAEQIRRIRQTDVLNRKIEDQSLASLFNLRFNDIKDANSPSSFVRGMFSRWDQTPTRVSPKENTAMLLKGKKPRYAQVAQEEYLADMIISANKFSDVADAFKPITVGKTLGRGEARVFDGHTRIHAQTVMGLIESQLGRKVSSMSKDEIIEAIRLIRQRSLADEITDDAILSSVANQRVLTKEASRRDIDRFFDHPLKAKPMQSMYNFEGRTLIPGIHDREIDAIVNAASKANFYGVKKDSQSLMRSMGFVSLGDGDRFRYDPKATFRDRTSYQRNIGKKIVDDLIDTKSILPLQRNKGGIIPKMFSRGGAVTALFHRGNLDNFSTDMPISGSMVGSSLGPALYADPRRSMVDKWGKQGDLVYQVNATKPFLDMNESMFGSQAMKSIYPKWADNLKKEIGIDIERYLPYSSNKFVARMRKLFRRDPKLNIAQVQAHVATELASTIAERSGIARRSRDGIFIESQINEQFRKAVIDSGFGGGRVGNIHAIYDLNSIGIKRTQSGPMLPPGFYSQSVKLNKGNRVPGTGNTDTVPAMLTPGEFVVNKEQTQKNLPLLHAINDGKTQFLSKGAPVSQAGGRSGSSPINMKKLDEIIRLRASGQTSLANRLEREYVRTAAAVEASGVRRQIDRAHTVVVDKSTPPPPGVTPKAWATDPSGASPWHGSKWAFQSNVENNLSNLLATKKDASGKTIVPPAQTEMLKRLKNSTDEQIKLIKQSNDTQERKDRRIAVVEGRRAQMTEKLVKNLALNNAELKIQAKLLEQGTLPGREMKQRTIDDVIKMARARAEVSKIPMSTLLAKYGTDPSPKFRAMEIKKANPGMTSAQALAQARNEMNKLGTKIPTPYEEKVLSNKEKKPMSRRAQTRERAAAMRTKATDAQTLAKQIKASNPGMTSSAALQEARSRLGIGGGGGGRTPTMLGMPGMGDPDGPGIKPKQSGFRAMYNKATAGVAKFGMGAGMGLSMAGMLPMMNQDEQGKFMGMDANTAMMGLMGGGMLLSLAPMMGAAAIPILGIAAAAGGVGLALKAWRNNVDETSKKTANLGANIGGTANALNTMAKMFGEQTPVQRRAKAQLQFTEPEQEEAFGKFQNYLGSELGQKFIKDLENSTSAERFKKLSDYLKNAIAGGILSAEDAKIFAKTVATSLGDPVIGQSVLSSIRGQLTGSRGMLDIARERDEAIQQDATFQEIISQEEGQKIAYADAGKVVGSSLQAMQDFGNAAALASEQYFAGTMSFDEYTNILTEATKKQNEYSDALQKAIESSTDLNGTMMAVSDQLLMMGLTQEQKEVLMSSGKVSLENPEVTKILKEQVDKSLEAEYGQLVYNEKTGMATQITPSEEPPSRRPGDQFSITQLNMERVALANEMFTEAEGRSDEILAAALSAVTTGVMSPAQAKGISDIVGVSEELYSVFTRLGSGAEGLLGAAFVRDTQVREIEGLDEEGMKAYSEIGVKIISEGYDLAAFRSFIDGLPESKRINIVTNMQGMSNRAQQAIIATGAMGPTTQGTLLGSSMYQRQMSQAANQRPTDMGGLGTAERGIESINDAVNDVLRSLGDETTADLIIAVNTLSNGKNQDFSTWIGNLRKLEKQVSNIQNNFPPEIYSQIEIDFTSAQDIADWNKMSDAFALNLGTLEQLDPNVDIVASMRFLTLGADGEELTPEQVAKNVIQLNSAWNDLKNSTNKEVRGKALLTIGTAMMFGQVGEDGEPMDMEAAGSFVDQTLKDLAEKTGGKVYNADPNIVMESVQILFDMSQQREQAQGLLDSAEELSAVGLEATASKARDQAAALLADADRRERQAVEQIRVSGKTGTGGGGGGGGAQQSPVEGFVQNILNQFKMWTDASAKMKDLNNARNNFVENVLKGDSIFKKLNKAVGFDPARLQEILGMGPEGAKEFLDKYVKDGTLTKAGKNILDAAVQAGIGQTIGGNVMAARQARQQTAAANFLSRRGEGSQVIQSIAGDPQKAAELLRLRKEYNKSLKGGNEKDIKQAEKALNKYINSERRLVRIAKEREEALKSASEKAIEGNNDIIEANNKYMQEGDRHFEREQRNIERNYRDRIKSSEDQIESLNDQIDEVNKLIEAEEKLNRADQDRIRDLQRQQEMLSRQLEELERANELDERRIETLSREDEIRNRTADALNRELELMSRAEEDIRESYQDRIEALDEVAKVNDYIINQQRQQIDLSRAISEGDIYAATAAAQEMRASSASFAVEQVRSGLEQGMENQVEGLRTSGGLTREQAEERIRGIEDQSYQTSLQIRDIEDQIYQRNLQMIPIKDQIRNYDMQIRDIQDQIYDRETVILGIQNQRLEPLQTALRDQEDILDKLNKQVEAEIEAITFRGMSAEQWADTKFLLNDQNQSLVEQNELLAEEDKRLAGLSKKWNTIAQQIKQANDFAQGLQKDQEAIAAADIASISSDVTLSGTEKAERIRQRNRQLIEDLEKIEADRKAKAEELMASGSNLGAYAGGLMKYAMGGIANPRRFTSNEAPPVQKRARGGGVFGDGSRDSIPAMLTPGEFVIRKAMVDKYGVPMMKALNQGSFAMPKYEFGEGAGEGFVAVNNNMVSNINAPVYNSYDMKFAINGANQSADEIANTVMFKMRQLQNQGIRTNRGY